MNSRLYFLLSFAFLSACMPTQKPESDAFIQSELMPPKEEITIVEEQKKDDDRSILEEILAAIKSPSVVTPQQTPPPAVQPVTAQQPQVAPAQTPPPPVTQPQQPIQQTPVAPAQTTPPPVVLPQASSNIMPQILQAAPNGNGGGSPFFQTIVLPQMAPFAYPTPMVPQAAPVAQTPTQPAPFYSTPNTQTQNYATQAPTQNAPVQPVQQPQPPVQQPQPVQQAQPIMEQANSYVSTNLEPINHSYQQQPQTYIPYVETQTTNDFYPTQGSAEVILPDTYQLPQVQQIPANHVMSGQEAYPVWQSENEVYYEEIMPTPTETQTPSLQSENINIPRW